MYENSYFSNMKSTFHHSCDCGNGKVKMNQSVHNEFKDKF